MPTAEPGQLPQATKGSDMHPFWAITRMQRKDDKCNCQITRKSTTVVVCAPPGPAGAPALSETFHAHIPYIYNTVDLKPDTKLVLKWHVKPVEKRNRTWVSGRNRTWVSGKGAKSRYKTGRVEAASGACSTMVEKGESSAVAEPLG